MGQKFISPIQYKQMRGRAGRKGKDTHGESVMMCSRAQFEMVTQLINRQVEPIRPSFGDKNEGMHRAILEMIVSGAATTMSELQSYGQCTLFRATKLDMEQIIETSVQ